MSQYLESKFNMWFASRYCTLNHRSDGGLGFLGQLLTPQLTSHVLDDLPHCLQLCMFIDIKGAFAIDDFQSK
jgi:hypothetical protein